MASPIEPEQRGRLLVIDWNPDERKLRQFGFAGLALIPLFCWLGAGRPAPGAWLAASGWGTKVALGLSLAGGLLAAVRPRWLRRPFVGATLLVHPIGLVVGELVLLAIYFLLFAPIAIFFRLIGRDALKLKREPGATTWWEKRRPPRGPESYFRQS